MTVSLRRKDIQMTNRQDELVRDVLGFIGRFSTNGYGYRQEVIECFTRGCCYWFAAILNTRFSHEKPLVMIDYVANHFGCEIGGRVYDITGDVTGQYDWMPWNKCNDPHLIKRIYEDCINF